MAPLMTSAGAALIWPALALDRDGLLRALAATARRVCRGRASSPLAGRRDGGPCRGARILRPAIDTLPRPNSAPVSVPGFFFVASGVLYAVGWHCRERIVH
jgi:hypothetical protein